MYGYSSVRGQYGSSRLATKFCPPSLSWRLGGPLTRVGNLRSANREAERVPYILVARENKEKRVVYIRTRSALAVRRHPCEARACCEVEGRQWAVPCFGCSTDLRGTSLTAARSTRSPARLGVLVGRGSSLSPVAQLDWGSWSDTPVAQLDWGAWCDLTGRHFPTLALCRSD